MAKNFNELANVIWAVADLLRGDYKQSDYGKVILPLVVIRRLDCVLGPTKEAVLKRAKTLKGKVENIEPVLRSVAGQQFYNTSPLDFRRLLDDPNHIADNLRSYIGGFSEAARDVIERFDFNTQIAKLDKANLLYKVTARFAEIDLHPEAVSNIEMGYLYEDLIRRFSELSNETAGEHFTPREVISLMVNLLLIEDERALTKKGVVRTLFDPACGTGGMLSVAEDHLRSLNPDARLEVFGQELNDETYAVCRSDMMLKGQDASHIVPGNSFSEDGHMGAHFDYVLANPPFGVEWKNVQEEVRTEASTKGFAGRFGAGLPRINDGSFLFLQHMISKMKPPSEGGSRLAIVFNGSPLFTGGAGSGESEIRRWIIENDWLEAVVALPDQLFYNTGISTYFWIVTNRKSPERMGKVQLVDARKYWVKMRKSLGEKRKQISAEQIDEITRLYGGFTEAENVKLFPNESLGFMRITVERPKRTRFVLDEEARASAAALPDVRSLDSAVQGYLTQLLSGWADMEFEDGPDTKELQPYKKIWTYLSQPEVGPRSDVRPIQPAMARRVAKAIQQSALRRSRDWSVVRNKKNEPEPDPALRDYENVPFPSTQAGWVEDPTERLATLKYRGAVEEYMSVEVLPHVPDAWVDYDKTKVGYEIPFMRHFYRFVPPRPLEVIDAEISAVEREIQDLLREVTE
jgi:type I restriction enzyme M protein